MVISQYLTFHVDDHPDRKTPIVLVQSVRSGSLLGRIAWHGPWHQFCFYPAPGTVFNNGCMTDIQEKIKEMMKEQRAK